MQTQTFSFSAEARKSLTAKGEEVLPARQVPDVTVRRFFGTFSLAQRKGPEKERAGAWNEQTVDKFFLLLRSPSTFILNSAQEAATDGVVLAADAFKSFKWD